MDTYTTNILHAIEGLFHIQKTVTHQFDLIARGLTLRLSQTQVQIQEAVIQQQKLSNFMANNSCITCDGMMHYLPRD